MSERTDFSGVCRLLNGRGCPTTKCDVHHGDGYDELVVKQNVCYIVAGIVINDRNEVLMVQEAKPSCRGRWYLPAGRMEPGETIVDGAKREVEEEAGLDFEPLSLLCVEECGGRWVRFSLIGKAVGGCLKTTDQADDESLQAKWWNQEDDLPMRCKDILPLIELGKKWKNKGHCMKESKLLPTAQPHSLLFLRILLLHGDVTSSEFGVLLIEEDEAHSVVTYRAPSSHIHPDDKSFYNAVDAFCHVALQSNDDIDVTILGVLGIEHTGVSAKKEDGIAISIAVRLNQDETPLCKEPYKWICVKDIPDENTVELLKKKVSNISSVPLRSLKL